MILDFGNKLVNNTKMQNLKNTMAVYPFSIMQQPDKRNHTKDSYIGQLSVEKSVYLCDVDY